MSSFSKSIACKNLTGVVTLLVLFFSIVSIIGYREYTKAFLDQYTEGGFRTGETALLVFDHDHLDQYIADEGQSEEYLTALERMDNICNSQGVTFIYVIRPDLTDYAHITFLFSTMNKDTDYSRYEFGFVRETTNEEYKEKYRALYEGRSTREVVIRDKGYIETDPHITAMLPVVGSDGSVQAILCVQRQMDALAAVRRAYVRKELIAFIIVALLVICGQSIYLYRMLLSPVRRITREAERFAEENEQAERKLTDDIRNKDEIGTLAASIDRMEEQVKEYTDHLTEVTAEKERINVELELASSIQSGILPRVFPPYPDRKEFELHATMNPAKIVSGDFYDFYLVDDDHLALVIADVSDKGVPAALLMMVSKVLLKTSVMMKLMPDEVLTQANTQLCQSDVRDMFVTVWLGILTISTGEVVYASAGHEYPAVGRAGEGFSLEKTKHGPPLGFFDESVYNREHMTLHAGDTLFLYTDGVPEATNTAEGLFGEDRMLETLNEAADAHPEELLAVMKRVTDEFSGERGQFDDLTMLAVRMTGET